MLTITPFLQRHFENIRSVCLCMHTYVCLVYSYVWLAGSVSRLHRNCVFLLLLLVHTQNTTQQNTTVCVCCASIHVRKKNREWINSPTISAYIVQFSVLAIKHSVVLFFLLINITYKYMNHLSGDNLIINVEILHFSALSSIRRWIVNKCSNSSNSNSNSSYNKF